MSDTNFQKNILMAESSFQATCWTELLAAGQNNDAALNKFCENYWLPLYAFARRQGKNEDAAKDATQGFFAQLIEKKTLHKLEEGHGKFRNYLLILFKRYMLNDYQRSQAKKRAGSHHIIDYAELEDFLSTERDLTPQELYEKAWALTLLEQVMLELQQRFEKRNNPKHFVILKPFISSESPLTYKAAAQQLGSSESAVKVAVHRLRKEFGKSLRLHVQATLGPGQDLQTEITFLNKILSS